MQIIPTKTPQFVKTMFPNFVWDVKTNENILYLTFDDGPTPQVTEWVLKQLSAYNAKATFFCIGNNIKKHPDVFHHIITEGHAIGNHTYNHLKGWKHKTKKYLKDIEDTNQIVKDMLDNSSTKNHQSSTANLFRPPYGKLKAKQAKAILKRGYNIVFWDVLSFDWCAKTSGEDCFKNVISKAKKGSIIVFHDSQKASKNLKYTLPRLLDYYSKKGFQFRAIKELPNH